MSHDMSKTDAAPAKPRGRFSPRFAVDAVNFLHIHIYMVHPIRIHISIRDSHIGNVLFLAQEVIVKFVGTSRKFCGSRYLTGVGVDLRSNIPLSTLHCFCAADNEV